MASDVAGEPGPAEKVHEMVVIGTGFGGAVVACRSAREWHADVLVLERGRRYPMGSFPRSPKAMSEAFWNVPFEDAARPGKGLDERPQTGLFDIREGRHINAVLGAGLGGGSLIYANVFLEPPPQVFEQGWPRDYAHARLAPYYAVARQVMGARPVPPAGSDPRRRIRRAEIFDRIAEEEGRPHQWADINVFFGNDPGNPTPIGLQEENRYGAVQTSCTYCGECDVGCNTHSKNTLDLNYLHVAEKRHGARVLTEHLATKIVPVNAGGRDDPTELGEHGYRVYVRDLVAGRTFGVRTRRVCVSAGALGSTELLMRCRDVHGTLPHVSQMLGQRFSANGDFLSFAVDGKEEIEPNYGPVITRITDYNLFRDFDRERAFILQDAAFPAFASWSVMGAMPRLWSLGNLWGALKDLFHRAWGGGGLGRIGFFMGSLLRNDAANRTAVLLCMGLDKGTGTMKLDRQGYLVLDWPFRDNLKLYDAVLAMGERFRRAIGGVLYAALPNWWWPFRHNVTVHALGGCILGDSPQQGVTSAATGTMGQVFGYSGLYVADGAIVPGAIGANPTATILALAEMVAEGITGRPPGADL
jgi:cholesterol oxidase